MKVSSTEPAVISEQEPPAPSKSNKVDIKDQQPVPSPTNEADIKSELPTPSPSPSEDSEPPPRSPAQKHTERPQLPGSVTQNDPEESIAVLQKSPLSNELKQQATEELNKPLLSVINEILTEDSVKGVPRIRSLLHQQFGEDTWLEPFSGELIKSCLSKGSQVSNENLVILLSHFDLNRQDQATGQTLLMRLAGSSNTGAYIKVLLRHGAETEQQDHKGQTALIHALEAGVGSSVKLPRMCQPAFDSWGKRCSYHR